MPTLLIRKGASSLNRNKIETNRSKIRVGFEMECFSPRSVPSLVNGVEFDISSDGSIRPKPGTDGREIKSQVLTLAMLKAAAEAAGIYGTTHKCDVNASTGFHVHVSLEGMSRQFLEPGENSTYPQFKILSRCAAMAQTYMHAICGAGGRRNRFTGFTGSRGYCNPIKIQMTANGYITEDDIASLPKEMRKAFQANCEEVYPVDQLYDKIRQDKYRHVTFHQCTQSNRGLYEVRAFSGTTKPLKVYAFCAMSAAILHKASCTEGSGIEMPDTPPVTNESTLFRTNMEQFFEDMEWTPNGAKFGLPSGTLMFPLDEIKAELLRLADKTQKYTPSITAEDLAALEATSAEESEREGTAPAQPRATTPPPGSNITIIEQGTFNAADLQIPTDVANITAEQVEALFSRAAQLARANASPTPAVAR